MYCFVLFTVFIFVFSGSTIIMILIIILLQAAITWVQALKAFKHIRKNKLHMIQQGCTHLNQLFKKHFWQIQVIYHRNVMYITFMTVIAPAVVRSP